MNIHPTAFAAWFGCLATALNLFPVGQLDGGHISYAVLGRRSTIVTYATILCLVGLSFVSSSWIVWTVLNVAMLFVFGPRHPRTYDEDVPLDTTRLWLARVRRRDVRGVLHAGADRAVGTGLAGAVERRAVREFTIQNSEFRNRPELTVLRHLLAERSSAGIRATAADKPFDIRRALVEFGCETFEPRSSCTLEGLSPCVSVSILAAGTSVGANVRSRRRLRVGRYRWPSCESHLKEAKETGL